MQIIEESFRKRFSRWDITLPEEDLKSKNSGFIHDSGLLIQYCFRKDETGDYLDYYAVYRMTDDTHERIYADGRTKHLPALSTIVRISKDPVENKRFRDEYNAHNNKVVKMLAEKGFDKFTINMALSVGLER